MKKMLNVLIVLLVCVAFCQAEVAASDGLVAYWSLDAIDAQGNVVDSVGGYDADVCGASTLTTDAVKGKAVTFINGAGWIIVRTSFPDMGTGDFTIIFWVKGGATNQSILSKSHWTNHTYGGYCFYQSGTSHLFRIMDGVSAAQVNTGSSSDTWASVACVRRTEVIEGVTENHIEGWRNGVLNATAIASHIGSITASSQSFMLGTDYAVQHAFTGMIDEVRIYDRALSEEEIKTQYSLGLLDMSGFGGVSDIISDLQAKVATLETDLDTLVIPSDAEINGLIDTALGVVYDEDGNFVSSDITDNADAIAAIENELDPTYDADGDGIPDSLAALLDAIEEAISKPGASGISRYGK
jgi:hypothetical protein